VKQKETLSKLSPVDIRSTDLAGEKIQTILTSAPGNMSRVGGVKVLAESGWFVARPSGTEEIYEIYGESFRVRNHLCGIPEEVQAIVSNALAGPLQARSPPKTNVKERP
jgi:phosphoglucomutase